MQNNLNTLSIPAVFWYLSCLWIRNWVFSVVFFHVASFLLYSREIGCEEAALTVAAFSSVSHLYKEEPTDHEEQREYRKIMGELIV